jgi:hypothetical protein
MVAMSKRINQDSLEIVKKKLKRGMKKDALGYVIYELGSYRDDDLGELVGLLKGIYGRMPPDENDARWWKRIFKWF